MFLWIVIFISYEGPFLDYAIFLLVPFLQVSFLFSFLMNLPGWSFSYPRISTIYYLNSKSLCLFFKVFYNLSFVRRPMEPGEWDLLYACGWGRGCKEMATYLLEFRSPRCVPSLSLIYLHVLHQWLADFSWQDNKYLRLCRSRSPLQLFNSVTAKAAMTICKQMNVALFLEHFNYKNRLLAGTWQLPLHTAGSLRLSFSLFPFFLAHILFSTQTGLLAIIYTWHEHSFFPVFACTTPGPRKPFFLTVLTFSSLWLLSDLISSLNHINYNI